MTDIRDSDELRSNRVVLDGAIVMVSRPAGSPGPGWTTALLIDGMEVCVSRSVNAAGDAAREYGAWGGPLRTRTPCEACGTAHLGQAEVCRPVQ